jgi:hypothetical protein
MPNEKNDKYEEIENNDLQTPGVRDDDDDMDLDDGMDVEEPEVVGSRHGEQEDPESGKNLDKDDSDQIPQDSDPSE